MEYGVRYNLYMYILVLAFTCTFEDVFYMYVHTCSTMYVMYMRYSAWIVYCMYMYMLDEDYSTIRECHALWVSDLVHYKCRLMSD